MQKVYSRINWENYPSEETPVNEDNLNKIDYAVDIIDDRVISLYGYESRAAESTTNAKVSETNAKTSEENAKESELLAQEYMENAFEYSKNARTSETNAKASEENAKESASSAQTSVVSAQTHASTSKSYAEASQLSKESAQIYASNAQIFAKTANDYATYAQTHANTASEKAEEVTDYADRSKSYAVGTNGEYREGDSVDNAKYYYEQAKGISEGLQGALLPMGTIPFSQLEFQTKEAGYMYNISDEFTTDSTFKEGSGYTYPAGTNVYYTADGYWDCLAGTLVTGVKGSSETAYRKGNINITPSNIGLGNVENKSSATIRNELTKENVTKALGYTPVETCVTYDVATATQDGLMSALDKEKIDGIAEGADSVSIVPTLISGVKIGTVVINGEEFTLYAPTSVDTATTAIRLGSSTVGSEEIPVYLNSGVATPCDKYAGGTAVILNGTSQESSIASFYAPTTVGTDGYILVSNGSGAPTWEELIAIMATGGTMTGPLYFANGTTYYVDSNGNGKLKTLTTGGTIESGGVVRIPNGSYFQAYDSSGTARVCIALDSNNKYSIATGGVSNTIQLGSAYTTATQIHGKKTTIGSSSTTQTEIYGSTRIDFLPLGGTINDNAISIAAYSANSNTPCLRPTGDAYLGDTNYRWIIIYSKSSLNVSSDRRGKDDIQDLDDKYFALWDNLLPKSYYIKADETHRRHLGFVAQDVEEAMIKAGLTYEECGFLHKDWVERDDYTGYEYSLTYDDLAVLTTAKSKKQQKEINSLKQELAELKAFISEKLG